MNEAQRYEDWFHTPFGRRADKVDRRILSELLSCFERPDTLLDVGCGPCHFADLWVSHGLRITGLDIALDSLSYALAHRNGCQLILGDGMALPFRDDSFDVVALITSLEFMASPDQALSEAGRVARQGLLIGALNSISPIAWWRRARGARAYRSARFFSPWELERLVRSSQGNRELIVNWKTGLYPLGWLDNLTPLPLGAFTGMSVRFR